MRHFRSLDDLSPKELENLLAWSLGLKEEHRVGTDRHRLSGRVLGLFFEKPSMRTRVSFESGIAHLGGTAVFLSREEVGLGTREPVADFARVISRYVDLLAVRTFSHAVIEELACYASCPVINALSDSHHPCQALADLATILEEFGRLDGIKVAFVGDGNNVARSLAMGCAMVGADFVLSAPAGYELEPPFLAKCQALAGRDCIRIDPDPARAVVGADIVYTDVWASMGQESEQAIRRHVFANYQVSSELMARTKPTARFLHCLPAHRGEEVTAEVIDGPQSLVVEQAANRLHVQKALMLWLLGQAS